VDSGNLQIDLVLSGTDGMSAGIGENLWVPVVKDFGDRLGNMDGYVDAAKSMQELAEGYGVLNAYTPSGPLLWYNADAVSESDVPSTPEELLAWTQAHPNEFGYPRPANSGVGRTFLQGLPYILGDKDPSDPINGWEKTWAYLKELDEGIDYYPSGTTVTMKELAEGTRDMIVSTFGWDINPRVLGIVPKEIETFALEGTHWVPDTQFMCIPKGVADDKVAVLVKLMAFMLEPAQQAYTYDKGYFYPGPAVKDVPLSAAPQESQDAIAEFGRPQYDKLIKEFPVE